MKARIFFILALLLTTACGQGTATPTTAPIVGPTNTFAAATSAPTLTATFTSITDTPAPTAVEGEAATNTPTGPLTDRAAFVSDVTIPDGTQFGPGSTFTKTWRLKNVGTSTWTKDYVIEFALGSNLAATSTVNLPNDVSPGDTVDISVPMTAPSAAGSYTSLWQLKSPAGAKFGVGANFDQAIYAQIVVTAGLPATGATTVAKTPGAATAVPTASGPLNPIQVSKITVSADTATFSGECPHTFVFTTIFEFTGGGTMKYQLEGTTTTQGFQLQLPDPIESTFTTNGPHTFGASFTLEMRDSVQGQVWLHILSPVDMVSDKTSFSLTCPIKPSATPLFTATPQVSATP